MTTRLISLQASFCHSVEVCQFLEDSEALDGEVVVVEPEEPFGESVDGEVDDFVDDSSAGVEYEPE